MSGEQEIKHSQIKTPPVCDIIITAAGTGSRMQYGINKIFIPVCGEPLLLRTVRTVSGFRFFRYILITVAPHDRQSAEKIIHPHFPSVFYAEGGESRAASVRNGMKYLDRQGMPEFVYVHDAVRPFITLKLIQELLLTAQKSGASAPAVNPVETVRLSEADGHYALLNRDNLKLMQTPQVICADYVRRFFLSELTSQVQFTDEISVVENFGGSFELTEGLRENIKITTPSDIAVAEYYARSLQS